MVLHISTDRQS
uniref:Uncharacterized protein n=1 Tax=Anguilla anguilla TaxID=7936 RepID=A0A0E9SYH8_ANGAN